MDMNINMSGLTQEQFDKLSVLLGEIKKENEYKIWKPDIGEKYYCISGDSSIWNAANYNVNYDNDAFSIGNYFKTKEEAEKMVLFLKIRQELRKLAGNEITVSSFMDADKEKWCIVYDFNLSEVSVVIYVISFQPNEIYFSSESAARKAIETIGEERLKKEYFGIEELL